MFASSINGLSVAFSSFEEVVISQALLFLCINNSYFFSILSWPFIRTLPSSTSFVFYGDVFLTFSRFCFIISGAVSFISREKYSSTSFGSIGHRYASISLVTSLFE